MPDRACRILLSGGLTSTAGPAEGLALHVDAEMDGEALEW